MRGVAADLALLLALSLLPLALAQEVKGPAVDRIVFRGLGSQDIAEQEIRAGNTDIFFYNLKSEAARALRARGDLTLVEVPSSTVSIVLNPSSCTIRRAEPVLDEGGEVRDAVPRRQGGDSHEVLRGAGYADVHPRLADRLRSPDD
jgi:hypothetical protein